jgi:hypothetical protein
MKNDNFDGFDWLNQQVAHTEIDFSQLRQVQSFLFMWNVFETVSCNRNASPTLIERNIDSAIQNDLLNQETYSPYIDYFRDRYFGNEGFDFDRLGLIGRYKQLVENTLKQENRDLKDIVFSLLLITYRIRNNTFHGNKGLLELPTQSALFNVVNNLLADYLENLNWKASYNL